MSNANDFVIENGVLTKYVGSDGDVVVPKGVTVIGEEAFFNDKNVVSVRLPYGTRKISSYAFAGCTSLQKIQLPKSLKLIEMGAFRGCNELRDIQIPEETDVSGLSNSNNKKHLLDNNGFFIIGNRLFGYYGEGKIVKVPEEVQIIGDMAFAYVSLDLLIIPGNPVIAPCLFGYNKRTSEENMPPIWFPDVELGSIEKGYKKAAIDGFFYLYKTDPKCLSERKSEYIQYLKSQRKRYYNSIINNESLLEIFLAESLVPKNEATQLLEENMKKLSPNSIALLLDYTKGYHCEKSSGNLMDLNKEQAPTLTKLKKQWNYKELEDGTISITSYKGHAEEITIPEQMGKKLVTEISKDAFSPYQERIRNSFDRRKIKRIVVPKGVKKIGSGAFFDCRSLTEVNISGQVKRINSYTFGGCDDLQILHLPKSVTAIHESAIGCNKKLTIYAPAGSYAERYAKKHNIAFVAE